MVHQVSVSRNGLSRRYEIKDSGDVIGECYRVSRGFHVRLNGIYFGLKQEPNRRGGSTCDLIKRLKDVPEFTERTLAKVDESDARYAQEKKVALESVVQVNVGISSGEVLNWLVAKALNYDVDLNLYGRFAPYVGGKEFDPLKDLLFVIDKIGKYVKTLENLVEDGLFSVTALKDKHNTGICCGTTLELAVLRCVAVSELGQWASVPSCLVKS